MLNNESAVLGSILIDPVPVLPLVRARITAEDFTLASYGDVFKAVCRLSDEGKAIDPITVIEQSKVSAELIVELMNSTPTAANVNVYIDGMVGEIMKRGLASVSDDITDKLNDGISAQDICVYIQDTTARIAEAHTTSELVTSIEACSDFYDYLSTTADGKKNYVSTGYMDLDRTLGGGFMNEGFYILAARPGCGKTTISLQMADKVARAGKPTLFMSLEMSKRQITAKRIAIDAGVNYTRVLTGNVEAKEIQKISESCARLSEYPLTINRKPSASVEDISFLAHQVKNLEFIVIDYLGLIRSNYGRSLYEKTTDISSKLKGLSRQLGVPILCLAQLNREVENRQGGKPRISDLRDSGAIEQDADGILLLSRQMDEVLEGDSAATALTCTVGKNRHGRTGEVEFQFFPSSGRIYAVKEF